MKLYKPKQSIKLKDFQRFGVKYITSHKGRILLADDMRLGKTVQTLKYIRENIKELLPIVIVCPSIAKWEWHDQALNNFGIKTTILDGIKPCKLDRNKIYVVNYDILYSWKYHLKLLRPKTIVLDECHFAKNITARRSKASRQLCKGFVHPEDKKELFNKIKKLSIDKQNRLVKLLNHRAKHIIAISGTPLTSRPIELFVILNILWPKVFNNYLDYGMRYCQSESNRGKIEFKGSKNLKELHLRLKKLGMLRRLKQDVIKDYKEPSVQVIPIDMNNPKQYRIKQRKLQNKLSYQKSKQKQLSSFMQMKMLAAELKMPFVFQWLNDFLERTNEKIVVFAHHHKIIKAIKDYYKDKAVVVDGTISHTKKKEAQTIFAKNKKVRIFIGNMQACGMAVSLKVSDTVVFVELPLTPGDLRQCEDRIFDITKNNQLFVYHLPARGTIEEIICKILQSKSNVVSDTLDGTAKGIRNNLYDLLEKELKKQ